MDVRRLGPTNNEMRSSNSSKMSESIHCNPSWAKLFLAPKRVGGAGGERVRLVDTGVVCIKSLVILQIHRASGTRNIILLMGRLG